MSEGNFYIEKWKVTFLCEWKVNFYSNALKKDFARGSYNSTRAQ